MKKLLVLSLVFSLQAFSYEKLETSLTVTGVENSKANQIATGSGRALSCGEFKGTYEGNTVYFYPEAKGGSGRYNHMIVYTLSDSYKLFDGVQIQHEYRVKPGRSFSLTLPLLKDDVAWLQQTVFLITRDLKTGETATKQIMFNVTRPVVLSPTSDPYKQQLGCFQTFTPFESVAGILSNGSTNLAQVLIKYGVQKIWTKTNGSQFGFYFSPLAWTKLGNIFSVYRNRFSQFSKQTVETIEVSSGYSLSPGDYIQLYEQRTRYVQPFDVDMIDSCGHSTRLEEEYYLQWWGIAYHAVPINPYDTTRPPVETIGVRVMNNCPAELTPEFANDENSSFKFVRTL